MNCTGVCPSRRTYHFKKRSLYNQSLTYFFVSQRSITLRIHKAGDILLQPVVVMSDKYLLDHSVEEYLIDQAEELPRKGEITIYIKANELNPAIETTITDAIHKQFAYESHQASLTVKRILDLGWKSLLLSFVFLVFMFFIALAITTFLPENTIVFTFRELFIILGWVALWRPADLLLYDWQTHRRKEKLFRRLAESQVIFQPIPQ
jgi:hypothetical protein